MKKSTSLLSTLGIFAIFGILSTQPAQAQISGSLAVTAPNGGETLTVGEVYRITWTASNNIDTIYLGYSTGPGSLDWIATGIPNTGYYDWTVNVGNTANTQFKIDITGYETGAGSLTDQSDNFFTVTNSSAYHLCEDCLSTDHTKYYIGDTPRITMTGLPANKTIYWTFYQDGEIVVGPGENFGDRTDSNGNFTDTLQTLDESYLGDWTILVLVGDTISGVDYSVAEKPAPSVTWATYTNNRAGYSFEYPQERSLSEIIKYPDSTWPDTDIVDIGQVQKGNYGDWAVEVRTYVNVTDSTLAAWIQNQSNIYPISHALSDYNATTAGGASAYINKLNLIAYVKTGKNVLQITGFNNQGVSHDFFDSLYNHLLGSFKFNVATFPYPPVPPIQPSLGLAHSVGANVSGPDGTVYFISTGNTRSPYTSAGAFLSYKFNTWAGVVPANSADMALPLTTYTPGGSSQITTYFIPPRNGSLINDKGTVYLITNGLRAGFTSEKIFKELGYSFNNVYPGDTSFMVTLAPINSSAIAHSDGTIINDGGTIYVMKNASRMGFPSMAVFDSWGYWIAEAVPSNDYDRLAPVSGVIQARMSNQLSI